MSPEEILDASNVDARSDVWSLGATLYELCAARAAFEGTELATIFGRILNGSTPDLRAATGGAIPFALEAVVARCLAKNPKERYQSAHELAEALERTLPLRATSPSHPAFEPVTLPLIAPAKESVSPRVLWLFAAAMLVCLVASFGNAALGRGIAARASAPATVTLTSPREIVTTSATSAAVHPAPVASAPETKRARAPRRSVVRAPVDAASFM